MLLPKEWRGFTSRIGEKEEAMPFEGLGKIEESGLKAGSSVRNQAFAAVSRKIGRFGKIGP